MRTAQAALEVVGAERQRQLRLQAEGRFKYTPSDDGMTDSERAACIMEEVGEVARNTLARVAGLVTDGSASDEDMLKELSQVAALCVAWMERL